MIAVLVVLAVLVFAVLAIRWAARHLVEPVPLPHRPAHGSVRPAGPRHRIEHAHTGSLSATEVRAALARQASAAPMPQPTRQQRRDADRAAR